MFLWENIPSAALSSFAGDTWKARFTAALSFYLCRPAGSATVHAERIYLSQFKILFVYILSAVHRIKATSGCI